uniref:Heparan-alpha-glucosaminide N-acetyltransferase catalytic domain-containing protein n=1 Tax=Oryza nivara TaxID=4536 RepID=A0A0E0FYD8_ORYNI
MDGGGQGVARRHGAVAEEDPDRRHGDRSGKEGDDDGVDVDEKAPPPRRTSRRVASLDVFRGLTVALMILVDGAGGEWPVIGHAPWNGCNLADFVMPFFLFIVGMAIPLSLKVLRSLVFHLSILMFLGLNLLPEANMQRIPDRGRAVRRVVLRTLKLLFWGILLQGGYSHAPDDLSYGVDMKHVRWCGILQRIALAYLVVAVLEIVTKNAKVQDQSSSGFSIFRMYFSQWIVACCILVIYLSLVYGIYVPDWDFRVSDVKNPNFGKILTVTCGTRGKLSPPCNAVGYIDRKVLGINHMYHRPAWRRHKDCTDDSPHEGPFKTDSPAWCYAPFEPEGLLSSLSAVLSTIIGVHYGHVLVHMKSHTDRLKQWSIMGITLLILGLTLHFSHAIPLNKQLYTFSYICVTAGAAGIVFCMFYFLVDILNLHYPFAPLKWTGMNAMLVYVMAAAGIFEGFLNGWYYEGTNNTLVYWVRKHVFVKVWHSTRVGILLYVLFAQILFWALVAGLLHPCGRDGMWQ